MRRTILGFMPVLLLLVGCSPVPTPSATVSLTMPTSIGAIIPLNTPSPIPAPPTTTATPVNTLIPTATPTRTSTPQTPTLTPIPTSTRVPSSLFEILVKPLVDEAQKRRAARAKTDAEFFKRIDQQLNAGRINVLLFGYGETYEPPAADKVLIGSYTAISYDPRTGKADLISLTHDLRAPEIERALAKPDQRTVAVKIDQAYRVGGFELMRRVIEDATGLAVDFQIAFDDLAIQKFIDDVFGAIEIFVPEAFDVGSIYINGQLNELRHYARGPQKMDGITALQFIKGAQHGYAPKSLERNARKHLLFQAMLESINNRCGDRFFWLRASAFLFQELGARRIAYDFDPTAMIINNISSVVASMGALPRGEPSCGLGVSKINRTLYVVDARHGDGGVQWAAINASFNPFTREDLNAGVFPDEGWGWEVPLDGNPRGDLATEYWQSVRTLVRQTLTDLP